MSRIVIALGGNALGNTPEEQKRKVEDAACHLVGLIDEGHEIIISHGNGPQVGMIQQAFEKAAGLSDGIPPLELPECTAMSQGYIGFHLQNAIKRELRKREMPWQVATVITQVEVDRADPAFLQPAKPIGSYLSQEQAEALRAEHPDRVYAEDAGRGWRRMVPSPKPIGIVERESILNLLDLEFIVIACGGGGIPVYQDAQGDYESISAVIDKDYASAKLAELVGADCLFILTAVDRVSIHWGEPQQEDLTQITAAQAEEYCRAGYFAPGSMLPKVEAALQFAKSRPGKRAVIASLEQAGLAMQGLSGTVIVN